ncbi:hypothetical protein [Nocardia aurantiaca]|uniref:Uncharacterized protein n=1 Tax=Nocardia aurantiaca TaxID=2675850 RepID=A0A6I3L855_9NOCA|nr:hypothetical protein [Nocardia aurantiaca]MTE17230.1 hypothetical protein [Nocardia aurantiaca]
MKGMAVVAWTRSTTALPMLAAGAMVLVLAGLTAAFVYGAVPAVAGPAGRAPAPVEVRTDTPAVAPACTEITEDSPNPACTNTGTDIGAEPAPADQP